MDLKIATISFILIFFWKTNAEFRVDSSDGFRPQIRASRSVNQRNYVFDKFANIYGINRTQFQNLMRDLGLENYGKLGQNSNKVSQEEHNMPTINRNFWICPSFVCHVWWFPSLIEILWISVISPWLKWVKRGTLPASKSSAAGSLVVVVLPYIIYCIDNASTGKTLVKLATGEIRQPVKLNVKLATS